MIKLFKYIFLLSFLLISSCATIKKRETYILPPPASIRPINSYVLKSGDIADQNLVVFSEQDAKNLLINFEELEAEIEKLRFLIKEISERKNIKIR